jgi:hypothetical protein
MRSLLHGDSATMNDSHYLTISQKHALSALSQGPADVKEYFLPQLHFADAGSGAGCHAEAKEKRRQEPSEKMCIF